MREFTAYRDVDVMDGKDRLSSFEVRYTFTISAGFKSRNWTNATDGNFYPAEQPSVDVTEVSVRWHPSHKWMPIDGVASDMVLADVTDAWFIQQATEQADA